MEEARDGNSDKTDKQEVEIKKIEIAYNEIKEYSNEIEGSLKWTNTFKNIMLTVKK